MVADRGHETPDARARWPMRFAASSGLPHRLELAGEYDGVGGSTTRRPRTSARRSSRCAGMQQPTVLLLGGRHKGEPYTRARRELRRNGEGRHRVRRGRAEHRSGPWRRRARRSSWDGRSRRSSSARARSPRRATRCCCRPRARATTCSTTTRSAARCSGSWPRADGGREGHDRASRRRAIAGAWASRRARSCCSPRAARRSASRCCTAPARSSRSRTDLPAAHYLLRQLTGLVVGVVAFAVAAKIDAERWNKWAWPLMVGTILAAAHHRAAVHESIAPRINGSRRFLFGALAPAVGARQARGHRVDVDAAREEGRRRCGA